MACGFGLPMRVDSKFTHSTRVHFMFFHTLVYWICKLVQYETLRHPTAEETLDSTEESDAEEKLFF